MPSNNFPILKTIEEELKLKYRNISLYLEDEKYVDLLNSFYCDTVNYPFQFQSNLTNDSRLFIADHHNAYNTNYFKNQISNLLKVSSYIESHLNLVLIKIDQLESLYSSYGAVVCLGLINTCIDLVQKKIESPEFMVITQLGYLVIVIPEPRELKAVAKIEEFHQVLSEHIFTINDAKLSLTFSFGVANYPNTSTDIEELKLASILALQCAIDRGGDRIVLY